MLPPATSHLQNTSHASGAFRSGSSPRPLPSVTIEERQWLMKKASTRTRSVEISDRTRELYEKRDRTLDRSEVPQLPPEQWAKGVVGKYYRPMKTQISFRIDNDVLDWLKSKGEGHLSRINTILRERMESEHR